MSESDSWDDYPWIPMVHEPPPKPTTKKKRKKKDLNKGKIPTAYMIREAKDGTLWHSYVDILRPHSPPVEWPEYKHRPLESDFPPGFSWDQISDIDEDPAKEIEKLGIPDCNLKIVKKKKKIKVPKKFKEIEEEEAREEVESKFVPEIPELIDDDNLYPKNDSDFNSVQLPPTFGSDGLVTDRIDDFYPADSTSNNTGGDFGHIDLTSPRRPEKAVATSREWDFDDDSGELSADGDPPNMPELWKEFQNL